MNSYLVSFLMVLFTILVCAGGGFFGVVFAGKRFLESIIEHAISQEVIDAAIDRFLRGWLQKVARLGSRLIRARFVQTAVKLVTAPETLLGGIITLGSFLALTTCVVSIDWILTYVGNESLLEVLLLQAGAGIAGFVLAWVFSHQLFDSILKWSISLSTTKISQAAGYVGAKLTKEVQTQQGS